MLGVSWSAPEPPSAHGPKGGVSSAASCGREQQSPFPKSNRLGRACVKSSHGPGNASPPHRSARPRPLGAGLPAMRVLRTAAIGLAAAAMASAQSCISADSPVRCSVCEQGLRQSREKRGRVPGADSRPARPGAGVRQWSQPKPAPEGARHSGGARGRAKAGAGADSDPTSRSSAATVHTAARDDPRDAAGARPLLRYGRGSMWPFTVSRRPSKAGIAVQDSKKLCRPFPGPAAMSGRLPPTALLPRSFPPSSAALRAALAALACAALATSRARPLSRPAAASVQALRTLFGM